MVEIKATHKYSIPRRYDGEIQQKGDANGDFNCSTKQ